MEIKIGDKFYVKSEDDNIVHLFRLVREEIHLNKLNTRITELEDMKTKLEGSTDERDMAEREDAVDELNWKTGILNATKTALKNESEIPKLK